MSKYKFEGNIIKLNEKDYNRWEKAYHSLDLLAELTALDDFYSQEEDLEPGKWFIRTSTVLANKQSKNFREGYTKPEETVKIGNELSREDMFGTEGI